MVCLWPGNSFSLCILIRLTKSLEVALNFKNHGNELYNQKSYRDAITAYTQGIDAGPNDQKLRVNLLNNRAACNIALKNYGAALKDSGVVIELAKALPRGPPGAGRDPSAKAIYRKAMTLAAMARWEEARDCVTQGRDIKGEEGNDVWAVLGEEIEKGERKVVERTERTRRADLGKKALRRAVEVSRSAQPSAKMASVSWVNGRRYLESTR